MRILILPLLLLLSSCSEEQYSYKPQDDPFVLKYFEFYLSESGINYEKDDMGFYIATNDAIKNIMVPLGNKASEMGLKTDSILVSSGCALMQTQDFLNNQGVIFHQYQDDGKTWLKTTQSDSQRLNIMERYAKYEYDCKKNI